MSWTANPSSCPRDPARIAGLVVCQGGENRGREPARIHLVVARDVEGTGNLRAQERLTLPRLAQRHGFHHQAVGELDVPKVGERPAVRGVRTDGEGRRRAVTRAAPGA